MPSHSHGVSDPGHAHSSTYLIVTVTAGPTAIASTGGPSLEPTTSSSTGISINNNGGDGAHSHTLPDFDVQYVDFIIATKS